MNGSTMPLRALTTAEAAVVDMFTAGTDLAVICDQSGLAKAQILAAVDLAKQLREARQKPAAATGATPKARKQPAPAPAHPVAVSAPLPQVVVARRPAETDDLLAWAESEGNTRARSLAAGVRARLAELKTMHERDAATAEHHRIVAVLEKQLAEAKERLREATDGASPKAATSEWAPVRAWAKANGIEVPDRGRVPKHVVAAYKRVHPETD